MQVRNLLAFAAAIALSGQAMAQSEPRRDARGIPVVSNPLPAGLTQPGAGGTTTNVPQDLTPTASPGNYPPCTREVTDGCKQTYERGVKSKSRTRKG